MGEDPREVEQRIENTRERMGETVDALSAKADVPARMKGYMEEKKDSVASKITGARERMSDDGGQFAGHARKGAGIAKENPLGLAIGSIAAGFLIGMLVPESRIENERLGPVAEQVKDHARDVGGEAVEHGKQVAEDAARAATETAKQSGQEHASDLQETVRDSTRQAAEEVRSS